MFNRILVPLDGSLLSERAIEPALLLGRQAGSEVIFARVPIAEGLLPAVSDRSRQAAHSYLESIRQANAQPDLTIRTLVANGDAAGAILDTASAEQADLIVMSTHGYSGISRWVLGSVTEKVLRSAPCPVLAIRALRPIRRIMIALDGSPLAECAIAPGLEMAARLKGEVSFLRAVPQAPIDEPLEEHEHGLNRRLQQELIEEAESYLHARSIQLAPTDMKIKTEVRSGPAANNILEFVETYGTDLIVMATHGRTGLPRWVYGSVTEKVLRGVDCSMLVIRPTATEFH